jgi:hypothetical protein
MKLEPFAMERMQSQWENRVPQPRSGPVRDRWRGDLSTR